MYQLQVWLLEYSELPGLVLMTLPESPMKIGVEHRGLLIGLALDSLSAVTKAEIPVDSKLESH